ncbi:hypothetical protein [Altererythrobacter lutimaris]|uniref:Uncharacterized protein n=1 Tax=Altererythrobacter lutimaris TaxID=2743979 RepID=A0A850HA30_9SPHN|nr:hypothetical protein [Altererythrobacter lutimaris]NVE93298.1 hypothetical protein [Altererythrobacter lutimaris]
MIPRAASSWQVTLADLSLILFLVTLTGLSSMKAAEVTQDGSPDASATQPEGESSESLYLAQSQSLFRAEEGAEVGAEVLAAWLSEQSLDPRATLTIIVQYPAGDQNWAVATAGDWLAATQSSTVNTRVLMQSGAARDAYASLGFERSNDVGEQLAN